MLVQQHVGYGAISKCLPCSRLPVKMVSFTFMVHHEKSPLGHRCIRLEAITIRLSFPLFCFSVEHGFPWVVGSWTAPGGRWAAGIQSTQLVGGLLLVGGTPGHRHPTNSTKGHMGRRSMSTRGWPHSISFDVKNHKQAKASKGLVLVNHAWQELQCCSVGVKPVVMLFTF